MSGQAAGTLLGLMVGFGIGLIAAAVYMERPGPRTRRIIRDVEYAKTRIDLIFDQMNVEIEADTQETRRPSTARRTLKKQRLP
jgi:hypothetical protein